MFGLRSVLATVAFLALSVPAIAEEVVCPQSIDVDQKIQGVPGGFATYIQDGPHQSSGISLFSGVPEELAMLKPDNGDEVAKVYRYSLGESPDEFWVVCHYGLTEVALKRKLETRVTYCESQADTDLLHRMTCR
jgi:hypothetical protein